MDIPIITNQWWSAYISAKQLSTRYFDAMVEVGYPANSCKYCSLGLACTLANDPETAPWGGLPRPTVLVDPTPRDTAVPLCTAVSASARRFGSWSGSRIQLSDLQ